MIVESIVLYIIVFGIVIIICIMIILEMLGKICLKVILIGFFLSECVVSINFFFWYDRVKFFIWWDIEVYLVKVIEIIIVVILLLRIKFNIVMIIKFGIDEIIFMICCINVLRCFLVKFEIRLYVILIIKLMNVVVIVISKEIWIFMMMCLVIFFFREFVFKVYLIFLGIFWDL